MIVVGASRSFRSLAAFLWRLCRRHRWSLPLTIGVVLCFVRLAREMQEGEVDTFDKLLQGMVTAWRGSLDTLMLGCTRWGGVLPMAIVSADSASIATRAPCERGRILRLLCGLHVSLAQAAPIPGQLPSSGWMRTLACRRVLQSKRLRWLDGRRRQDCGRRRTSLC